MVSQNYKIKITQTAQPGSKAVNYLDLTCLARAFFPSTIPAYMKISLVKLGFLSHSPAAPKQHALSIPISLLLWSLTRWTWIWVNSGSWWWTGRPGVLRFMGSQRVRHDWATELNWTELMESTEIFCSPLSRLKFYPSSPLPSREVVGSSPVALTILSPSFALLCVCVSHSVVSDSLQPHGL